MWSGLRLCNSSKRDLTAIYMLLCLRRDQVPVLFELLARQSSISRVFARVRAHNLAYTFIVFFVFKSQLERDILLSRET